MQTITLDVILRAVFGVSDPQRRARLHESARGLLGHDDLHRPADPGAASGALGPLERLQETARDIDALLLQEIAERRRDPGEDICSLLVQARFEDGTGDGATSRSATS